MKNNVTMNKKKSSNKKEETKVNFIDNKINKLRRKKNSKFAMLVVDFHDFYKKNLYKKHLVIYVISLILFFIMLIYYTKLNNTTSDIGEIIKSETENNILLGKMANFKSIFTDKILLNFVLLLSGITPYIYIPAIGVLYSNALATNIVALFNNIASNMNPTFMTIGSIVQLFGVALTSAMGIYFCKISTKIFKYSQKVNFTFNDVKKEYYTIRKDDKKLEEALKKEEKRKEEIEKLNVKVPYKNIIISFIISSLIIIVGGLITLI